jgi:hypothetical protein
MNAIKVVRPANRLYALAHEKAVAIVGKDVFAFQNDTVKHALVAVQIIHIVNGQDEDSPAEKRCDLLFSLSLCNAEKYGNH